MGRARRRSGLTVVLALLAGALVVAPAVGQEPEPAAADLGQTPTLPPGFADVKVIGNVSEATSVDFAPDGTAFVALKTGVIKSFDYDSATGQFEGNATATDFADLTTNVNNYWDRGLTGIAVDPQFGTAGHNFVYVNYTYNRDPRDTTPQVPKWGPPGQAYDDCAAPATTDPPAAGCVVMMRVTRIQAVRTASGWLRSGAEQELLASGCFQFGSHASGDVAFGPDGKLYASTGDGASFDTLDHGQYVNPCGDPVDQGGSLRSQDFRTGADPLGTDGTVVRIDPVAGLTPTQATAGQWLVAYGQRNPWRLTFRPQADGSGPSKELWSGDVGASNWEEVNRIPDVTTVTSPLNRGWPCYEGTHTGSAVQPGWDALDLPLCESLYAQGPSAVVAPYFSYQTRGPLLTPGEDCLNDTSSVSGIAFAPATSNYPAAYENAMFFSDYARACIWVLGKLPNGDPDPASIQPFVQGASTPVDLLAGPGGDLYYVDYGLDADGVPTENAAGVHRIVYTGSNASPTARITADRTSGAAPLTVAFDGTTSTDPDGDALTYRWDLDGNGSLEATGATPSRTYAIGTYPVTLQVDDGHGHTSTATQQIQAGNTAPTLGAVTPDGSLTWTVGQAIAFSASATDQQQGALPASAFSWNVAVRHCPSDVCHTHSLSTFSGVASGSFPAPDHEYPSHLLLTVTVTDSGGLTDTRTIQLNPRTVVLSFASSPTGATVTVNGADHATPYNETFLQGSRVTVTAAPNHGSSTSAFGSWSDGGARSHELSAPTTATTYTATYRPTAALSASPTSGPAPLTVGYTASATNAPGVAGGFSYAWDLDNDGQYDDGTGAARSVTHQTQGSKVVGVQATDSRGVTATRSVTVTVGPANQVPVPAVAATPGAGPAPLAVTLSAAGSADPDGDPVTYAWDTDADGQFDDGATQTAAATYTGVGPHTATVRVSDDRGGSATRSVTVTVTNSGPTARITTTPLTLTGTAPFHVDVDGSTSTDPDGLPLTYAWDLDGDGQYGDSTQPATGLTYGVGTVAVGLRVTDSHGATSTASVTVTATNTAPAVTRVSSYPEGGFHVGQTLGFVTAALDAQQSLPSSAYTVVMQRQACDAGCPRVEVQRWTGVTSGQYVVPPTAYPAHLYLVVTATDDHGASGSEELRIDPQPVTVTVAATRGLRVGVDGVDRKGGWSTRLVRGTTVRVVAPRSQTRRGVRWVFVRWSDGGARRHEVTVWDPTVTVRAVYRKLR